MYGEDGNSKHIFLLPDFKKNMLFDVTDQFLGTSITYEIQSQKLSQKSQVTWRGETFTAHKCYNVRLKRVICFLYLRKEESCAF